jgi:hypothetical protein
LITAAVTISSRTSSAQFTYGRRNTKNRYFHHHKVNAIVVIHVVRLGLELYLIKRIFSIYRNKNSLLIDLGIECVPVLFHTVVVLDSNLGLKIGYLD